MALVREIVGRNTTIGRGGSGLDEARAQQRAIVELLTQRLVTT
jgi:hypothetical protein